MIQVIKVKAVETEQLEHSKINSLLRGDRIKGSEELFCCAPQ